MTFEQWLETAGVKINPFIAEPVTSWCRAAWKAAIESAVEVADDTTVEVSNSYYAQLGDASATKLCIIANIKKLAE
jgi:hypothetical protein